MARNNKKDFFESYDVDSLSKVAASCLHFGECGGCRFQDISYADQIEMKKKYLHSLFKKEITVHHAPKELAYRNRMDFVYQNNSLCLRKRNEFNTMIPLSTCLLLPEAFQPVFSQIQELLKSYQFTDYDVEEKKGFLRYIVFRMTTTGELLLLCTTTTPSTSEEEQFIAFLQDLHKLSSGVMWYVYDDITDVSIPPVEPKLTLGKTSLTEKYDALEVDYGPKSFFQSNTAMATKAMQKMKEYVKGNTVDVCCGVGSIGLFVAQNTTSLTGIETIQEAIDYAKGNAQKNSTSAYFFCDDMKNVQEYTPLEIDTVILDPPRPGVGKKPLKRVLELLPERIIYLSCNPKTQQIDLNIIKERNPEYTIIFHEAYDFFPQTPHVESLVVLEKKS